jgi:hypothetical protein
MSFLALSGEEIKGFEKHHKGRKDVSLHSNDNFGLHFSVSPTYQLPEQFQLGCY